jgi:hypothetical protein
METFITVYFDFLGVHCIGVHDFLFLMCCVIGSHLYCKRRGFNEQWILKTSICLLCWWSQHRSSFDNCGSLLNVVPYIYYRYRYNILCDMLFPTCYYMDRVGGGFGFLCATRDRHEMNIIADLTHGLEKQRTGIDFPGVSMTILPKATPSRFRVDILLGLRFARTLVVPLRERRFHSCTVRWHTSRVLLYPFLIGWS